MSLPTAVHNLLLVRLLESSDYEFEPIGDICALLEPRWLSTEVRDAAESELPALEEAKFLKTEHQSHWKLLPNGRHKALTLLGVKSLPKGTRWQDLKTTSLTACALGIQCSPTKCKSLAGVSSLRAEVIRQFYSLDTPPVPSKIDSDFKRKLIWALIGMDQGSLPHAKSFQNKVTWLSLEQKIPQIPLKLLQEAQSAGGTFTDNLCYCLLSHSLKLSSYRDKAEILSIAANRAYGLAPTADLKTELRQEVIHRWILRKFFDDSNSQPSYTHQKPIQKQTRRPYVLTAQEIIRAAQETHNSGRFGDHRVYINHVWKTWQQQHHRDELDLRSFKSQLLALKRQRAITLGRADMPHLLDAENQRYSRIEDGEEAFVFVKIGEIA